MLLTVIILAIKEHFFKRVPYLTCLCFEAQTRGNDTEAAQCVSVVISTYFGLNSIALGFDTAAGDDHDFKGT